ncbi:MAG TPA: hypothetical protein VE547_20555, partial [Mycobacteriales bacterium]|nr:hypothetical protein [Mycobacteriales bacterium]
MEVPGRYRRWLRAFAEPCLRLDGRDRRLTLTARTPAGRPLLAVLARALDASGLCTGSGAGDAYAAVLLDVPGEVAEESRTRRPSLVSLLRVVTRALAGPDDDPWLGLYGAFGYDLGLQLFGLPRVAERAPDQRELALFVPDRLLIGTGPADLREVRYRFTDTAAPAGPPPAQATRIAARSALPGADPVL